MNDYLPPRLLQIIGAVLLAACCVASWGFNRDVTLFVGAAMGLLLLGGYRSVTEQLRRPPEDSKEPGP